MPENCLFVTELSWRTNLAITFLIITFIKSDLKNSYCLHVLRRPISGLKTENIRSWSCHGGDWNLEYNPVP